MKRRWSSLQLDKDSKRTNFCHVNHSWWPREFWEVVKNKHFLINWMQKVLLHIRNVRNESVEDISRKKVNWSDKGEKEQKFMLLMRYVVLPGCPKRGQRTTIEPDFIKGNNFYLLFVLALLLGDDIQGFFLAICKVGEGQSFVRVIDSR